VALNFVFSLLEIAADTTPEDYITKAEAEAQYY
jgi:hypothetical protein